MEGLFSFGTLRDEQVQMRLFGRRLEGAADGLIGYRLEMVTITDAAAIAISGHDRHPMLVATGQNGDAVDGMVFQITAEELARADIYEDAAYKRVRAPLRSGGVTWVYVQA